MAVLNLFSLVLGLKIILQRVKSLDPSWRKCIGKYGF